MAQLYPPHEPGTRIGAGDCRSAEFRSLRTGRARLPRPSKSTGKPQAHCLMQALLLNSAPEMVSALGRNTAGTWNVWKKMGGSRAPNPNSAPLAFRTDHQSPQAPNSSAQHRAWTRTWFAHADGEMAVCCGPAGHHAVPPALPDSWAGGGAAGRCRLEQSGNAEAVAVQPALFRRFAR